MNFLANLGRVVLALLAETGRIAIFLKDALLQGLTPTIYVRQILDQMMQIGYNSLPVVGLTAFFTGGALALADLSRRLALQRRKPGLHHRGARHHARAGPGARRPHGGGPRRRLDRGRARHHARHRADRCADDARHQPVQISRRPAPHRRRHHLADPRRHRRHDRHHGRLYRRHPLARLQLLSPTSRTPSTSCSSTT